MTMLLTLAARYLAGRKLRTALTTLAIIFGVAVIFAVNCLLPTILGGFERNLLTAAGQVDLSIHSETNDVFDASAVATVRDTPGVAAVTGILNRTVTMPRSSRITTLQAIGVDPATAAQTRVYRIESGRFLAPADAGQAVVVIDAAFAEAAGLALGGTLDLPTTRGVLELTVVGITAAPVVPGQGEAYLPLDVAQRAFSAEGKVNSIEAAFEPGADRESVTSDVVARMGPGYEHGGAASQADVFSMIETAELAVNMIGVLALFMGAFLIFNTFRTSVAERQRDIGMLRAVGSYRETVLLLILTESLLQGIIGTAAGLVLGFGFAAGMLGIFGSVMQSYIRMELPSVPVVSLGTLAGISALGIGVTVISGLWPAVTASRMQPLAALRPAPPEVTVRARRRGAAAGAVLMVAAALGLLSGNIGGIGLSAVLFLAGLVLVAPALVQPIAHVYGRLLALFFAREGHLAEANLGRQPGRAAVTASALMIGLAIVVAVGGIVVSMRDGFLDFLYRSVPADYLLLPPTIALWSSDIGASPELEARIAQVDGIAGVTGLRFALGMATPPPGSIAAKGANAAGQLPISMMGIDPASYGTIAGLTFAEGDPAAAYAALASGHAAILNSVAATQLQAKIGDEVEIRSAGGPRRYRVAAIANDFMMAKLAALYISHADLAADFGRSEDMVIQAQLRPGLPAGEIKRVTAALQAIVADYPQFTLYNAAEWRAQQAALFESAFAFLGLVVLVLIVPSILGLINTLAINVIERTREIGMLRAIGTTRQQVQRMVLAESLLLAAAGSAFGLLAGVWLGYVVIAAIRQGMGIPLPYYFPAAGIIAGVAAGLLIGVFAALLPARQASRLQIVEALHYE